MKINKPFIGTICEIDIETWFPDFIENESHISKHHIIKTANGYVCDYFDYIITTIGKNNEEMVVSNNEIKGMVPVPYVVSNNIIKKIDKVFRKEFKVFKEAIIDGGCFEITLTNELGELFIYKDVYDGNHEEITSIIEKLDNE